MESKQWVEQLMTDLLICHCCTQELVNPRSLSCQHAFCTTCLEQLVDNNNDGRIDIVCPTCQCETRVPQEGIMKLPISKKLVTLDEFRDLLIRVSQAKTPSPTPSELTNSLAGSFTSLSTLTTRRPMSGGDPIQIYCSKHRQLLNIYCSNCSEDICANCLHEQHKDHNWNPAGEFTSKITEMISVSNNQLHKLEQIPPICENRIKEVSDLSEVLQEDIEDAFRHLHNEVEARKHQLLETTKNLTQRQVQLLKLHSSRAQHHFKLLTAFQEAANDNISNDVNQKPVLVFRECSQKLESIVSSFRKEDLSLPTELKVNAGFWQIRPNGSQDFFKKYSGQVILRQAAQSSDLSIDEEAAQKAIAGLPTHFKVAIVPTEGKAMPMFADDIICSLESEAYGDISLGSCKRDPNGTVCHITYTTTKSGPHLLKLFLDGILITKAPLRVNVSPSLQEMEKHPQVLKQGKKQIRAVAVSKNGDTMLLVKPKAGQIKVYSPEKKSKTAGKRGTAEGQLMNPTAVALIPNTSHFLVTDTGNHRLQKFSLQGKFVAAVGSKGDKRLQFNNPTAITVDNNGYIYVIEVGNNRIQVLTSDLQFHRFIPCIQGATPTCVTVDKQGLLYVGYQELHCIQKLQQDGKILNSFGSGHISQPSSICTSRLDLVFVGDDSTNSIIVFTTKGDFLYQYGHNQSQSCALQISKPASVATDDLNHVYIVDAGNGRLVKL